MIKLENIHKFYGSGDTEVHVLRGLNVHIRPGEFVAIMGPSGSGKSTLLSILGALNTPTRGACLVDDIDVYSLTQDQRADFRREYLGFVFQNFHLVPYLSLLENVMLVLTVKKMKSGKKRALAQEALAKVGLADKGLRLPSQVSGGEQERAAIARAIVNQPPIILADEPTGNLDGRTGREVMTMLHRLQDQGLTIVMVTHSDEYAGQAGRIIKMADGVLVSAPVLGLAAA